LYRRQAPAHRATLHRHLGERLVTLYGQSSEVGAPAEGRSIAQELAHHFEQGGDWPQAVKYLRLAAQVAARRNAHREATANLEHALELATKLPESVRPAVETEILDKLAGMYHGSLDDVRAVETYVALRARAAQYGLVDVEIRALINLAYPLSYSSTDKCLEVLDRALELSSAQRDPLARARTRVSCLVRRIWARGWNEEDADQCRKALAEIRRSADRAVVALHLMDCSLLQWFSSNYREAHRVAIESLARFTEDREDNLYLSFPYWLSRFLVPRSLLFLGDWAAALREIDAAIALAEKNGDSTRAQPLYLGQAWVQLFGMDYAKARDICLSVLPLLGNPGRSPWRRLAWVIAGTAEVGLGNHERALEHLLAAKQEMDSHTVIGDWHCRMMLQAALADLWLARGDLRQAKSEGEVFVTVACATAERTWQALAWEVNARIAMAVSEPERAQDCITKALSAMDGFEVPLAEWRVHATAAELSVLRGHSGAANHHRELSRATVLRLAHSLPEDHPLRITFLSTPSISTIVAGARLVQGSG
jgi:tetratricopeptide (TPR) repeat protein